MRTLALVSVLLLAAGLAPTEARADIVDPPLVPRRGPAAYRVRVTHRDALAGRTLVGLSVADPYATFLEGPSARYTVLDDFAYDDLTRICAFPSDRIGGSLGGLGPPMLRDARTGAGGLVTGQAQVDALLALFDADDVACATITEPPADPALEARHVEGIEDTIRPVAVHGRALEVALVSVSFEILGQPPIVVPAGPDHARPTLPPEQRGCGCGVARRGGERAALSIALGLILVVVSRRSGARR